MRTTSRAWRSAARIVVLGFLIAFVSLASPAGPAAPALAGCEARTPSQMRAEADAAAIGTIVAMERARLPIDLGTRQDTTYWFEIAEVYHGTVHELIEVESSRGYDLDLPAEGRSYLLFLRGDSPMFYADGCSSMPMPLTVPEAADEVAQWQSAAPEPGGAELPPSGPSWPAIGLGALVLAMVLVLVRDARRRSRKQSAVRDTIKA